MRTLATDVPRTLIDAEILAARFPGHDPARWALPLLDALTTDVRGWQLVELERKEFAGLWLPTHAGEPCHGDTMALGEGERGGTVAALGAWLADHADAYAEANRSCWSRLVHAAAAPAGAVVVSRTSVGDRIKPATAELVVVDGLHRALAWWRRGDRTCRAYLPTPGGPTL